MPIRFAAPPARTMCRMPRDLARSTTFRPSNDNRGKQIDHAHLRAALRHFAQHGLAAADHARTQAMLAAEAGDRQTFEWWLEICRALDRRMANNIEAPLTAGK